MSSTRESLQKLVDKLDGPQFKRMYCSVRHDTYGKRRNFISSYLWEYLKTSIDIEDRDQLRRYFDLKYEVAQTEPNKYGHIPSVWGNPERNDLAIKLFDVAVTLENDGNFDRAYKRLTPTDHAGDRRNVIALACRRLKLETPHGAFYEQLRRYFDDTMGVKGCDTSRDTASYAKDQTIEFWLDEVRYPADCARHAKQPPTTKEPPMTWKEELIAARAAGETIQVFYNGKWLDENSGNIGVLLFNYPEGEKCYRVKPKEQKAAPLTWQGALKAARERGATIQFLRGSTWEDEGTNGLRPRLLFVQNQNQYRVKPGTDPLELPVHVPGCPIPIPSPEYLAEWQASQLPKENTMSKPITITTTTFVNGADISKMADSEVFGLIASEEAVIEDLKKIKAQPKKLVAEIAKREAGIAALVAYLDSKEG